MQKQIIVHGKVQGVFFRDYTRKKAIDFGLKGYVKNMPDGTVKIVVDEPQDGLDDFIRWVENNGSPSSRVDKVDVKGIVTDEKFNSFEIRH